MCRPTALAQLRPAAALGPGGQRPASSSFATRRGPQPPARGGALYQQALSLTRVCDYEAARVAFEETVTACPGLVKAWVSYAQVRRQGRPCQVARRGSAWCSPVQSAPRSEPQERAGAPYSQRLPSPAGGTCAPLHSPTYWRELCTACCTA